MRIKLHNFLIIGIAIISFSFSFEKQKSKKESQIMVAMRTIGHTVALQNNDSTSRILPVLKTDNRYVITFQQEFDFDPNSLIEIVDHVLQSNDISMEYVVEMIQCNTPKTIYSYEVSPKINLSDLPCRSRLQPLGCYELHITLLDQDIAIKEERSKPLPPKESSTKFLVLFGLLAIGGAFVYFGFKKKDKPTVIVDDHLISLGQFIFDRRNMELTLGASKTELTSKETDLLFLLHSSVNKTIDKREILKVVWGDDGDYVGRTLDVFISKLRKKLENDPTVKIINIRGVGYRLVMNEN